MEIEAVGEVWHWRGPAPFHFVTVPDDESARIHEVAALVTYGWGMIPVSARVGGTTWTTSLFAKDGLYVVPLKDAIRAAEGVELGDTVTVLLTLDVTR
ncbi:MAG: hypothetical protein K0R97_269 [Oerskovia sp.]|jgi:hypothetical protein|nr:hypothetical protein [Oerskovia sp.]